MENEKDRCDIPAASLWSQLWRDTLKRKESSGMTKKEISLTVTSKTYPAAF